MKNEKLKPLVFLWYLPIVIVMSMGLLVSLQGTEAARIVDKARVFQDTHEASTSLDRLYSKDYSLTIGLDEKFKLSGPDGVEVAGDYRAGDKLVFPLELKGEKAKRLTSGHLEFIPTNNESFIVGLNLGVRLCQGELVEETGEYRCKGSTEVRVGSLPVDNSTYSVMKPEESVGSEGMTLLIELSLAPDTILPVKGYKKDFSIQVLGLLE